MQLIKKLFTLLIIFSSISYIEHAMISIINSEVVNFTYSRSNVFPTSFGNNIRYVKDFIVVILFILLIINYLKKTPRSNKFKEIKLTPFLLMIAFILLEGMFSLFISGDFSLGMIISGFRGYIYLIVIVIISLKFNDKENYIKNSNILNRILLIEMIIVMIQALNMIKIYGVNKIGNIRIPGTFDNSGNLSSFLLGLLLNNYILSFIVKEKSIKKYYIYSGLINVGIILTGSRASMIIGIAFMLIPLMTIVTRKISYKRIYLELCSIIVILSLIPLIIKLSEIIANRGNILSVNLESGRIRLIIDYIFYNDIFSVFFGKGLGYGTNTGVLLQRSMENLNVQSEIMDGTINTFITQFGIITLIIVLIFLPVLVKWFFKHNYTFKLVELLPIMLLLVITIINGNIFEQYIFLIVTIYSILSIKVINLEDEYNKI